MTTKQDRLILAEFLGAIAPDVLRYLDRSRFFLVSWVRDQLPKITQADPKYQKLIAHMIRSGVHHYLEEDEREVLLNAYQRWKQINDG